MPKMRRRVALLQRAGRIHHQFAEMQDAEIGRPQMFAAAVGDRALAVLHRGVLLGDALDAGVAFRLLQLAVDQVVVRLVAQRHIIVVDLGDHAVAAVIGVALGLRQRPFRIPGIGVDPAIGIGDGNKTLAENALARHRARRIGMHRHQKLRDAPVDIVAAGEPSARDRQPRLVRIDLDHRARVLGDPAHVIGIHPCDRIDEMLLDVEDFVLFLVEAQMREGEMRGVDRAFQRLHPVAVLPFLRDVAVRGRHQRHFQVGQLGHLPRRAHIGPDHVAPFAHRIGFDPDQVFGIEIGIGGRHVDAAAVGVEFPAVIDAADAAFLVAAEPEIGAAVRAVLVDHADHAARIAEREQLLAHHDDLLRRAVGFGQFLRQQHRQPEPAQQFAHPRSRTAFGQEFVVLGAEHGVASGVLVLLFCRVG